MGCGFSRLGFLTVADKMSALRGHLGALADAEVANQAFKRQLESFETQLHDLKTEIRLTEAVEEAAELAEAAAEEEIAEVVNQLELLEADLEAALEAIDLEEGDDEDLELAAEFDELMMAEIDPDAQYCIVEFIDYDED